MILTLLCFHTLVIYSTYLHTCFIVYVLWFCLPVYRLYCSRLHSSLMYQPPRFNMSLWNVFYLPQLQSCLLASYLIFVHIYLTTSLVAQIAQWALDNEVPVSITVRTILERIFLNCFWLVFWVLSRRKFKMLNFFLYRGFFTLRPGNSPVSKVIRRPRSNVLFDRYQHALDL